MKLTQEKYKQEMAKEYEQEAYEAYESVSEKLERVRKQALLTTC